MLQCNMSRGGQIRASPQRERVFGAATIFDRLSL